MEILTIIGDLILGVYRFLVLRRPCDIHIRIITRTWVFFVLFAVFVYMLVCTVNETMRHLFDLYRICLVR